MDNTSELRGNLLDDFVFSISMLKKIQSWLIGKNIAPKDGWVYVALFRWMIDCLKPKNVKLGADVIRSVDDGSQEGYSELARIKFQQILEGKSSPARKKGTASFCRNEDGSIDLGQADGTFRMFTMINNTSTVVQMSFTEARDMMVEAISPTKDVKSITSAQWNSMLNGLSGPVMTWYAVDNCLNFQSSKVPQGKRKIEGKISPTVADPSLTRGINLPANMKDTVNFAYLGAGELVTRIVGTLSDPALRSDKAKQAAMEKPDYKSLVNSLKARIDPKYHSLIFEGMGLKGDAAAIKSTLVSIHQRQGMVRDAIPHCILPWEIMFMTADAWRDLEAGNHLTAARLAAQGGMTVGITGMNSMDVDVNKSIHAARQGLEFGNWEVTKHIFDGDIAKNPHNPRETRGAIVDRRACALTDIGSGIVISKGIPKRRETEGQTVGSSAGYQSAKIEIAAKARYRMGAGSGLEMFAMQEMKVEPVKYYKHGQMHYYTIANDKIIFPFSSNGKAPKRIPNLKTNRKQGPRDAEWEGEMRDAEYVPTKFDISAATPSVDMDAVELKRFIMKFVPWLTDYHLKFTPVPVPALLWNHHLDNIMARSLEKMAQNCRDGLGLEEGLQQDDIVLHVLDKLVRTTIKVGDAGGITVTKDWIMNFFHLITEMCSCATPIDYKGLVAAFKLPKTSIFDVNTGKTQNTSPSGLNVLHVAKSANLLKMVHAAYLREEIMHN